MENVKENTTTVYCVNNCGFFGSPNTNNLCSKCYSMKKKRKEIEDSQTDSEKLKQQKVESIPELDLPTPKEEVQTVPLETTETAKVETENSTTTPTAASSVDPSKCYSCNKKIGLTAIKCRCGFKFCGKHRYSDQHNCSYDYKESGKKELSEKNPKVGGSKLVAL